MTHTYKLQSALADLFIYRITDRDITYEVRSKDDGKLLEPRRTSKYDVTGDNKIFFDGRDIRIEMVGLIAQTLNS